MPQKGAYSFADIDAPAAPTATGKYRLDDVVADPWAFGDRSKLPTKPASAEDYLPAPKSSLENAWDTVKGLGRATVGQIPELASAVVDLAASSVSPSAAERTTERVKGIGTAHVEQFAKAKSAFDSGMAKVRAIKGVPSADEALDIERTFAEALGHVGGGAIPLLGPAAAAIGEKAETDPYGALGEGGGLVASVLAPTAIKAVGGKRVPAIAANRDAAVVRAVEAGQAAGVPIDAATATGNPFVKFAQKTADESLLGSFVGGRARAAQQAGLATMGEQLAAKANAGAVTPTAAGEAIQAGIEATKSGAHAAADVAYTRLRQIEAANPVQVDLRAAKAAVEPIYANIAAGADIAPLQGGKAVAARAMARLLNGPDFAPLSVADSSLSDLKELLRREVPTARFQVDQLERAVQTGVRQMGPDAVTALQEGRAATRAKYAADDVLQVARGGQGEPVGTFTRATRAGDQSANHLRDVLKQAPDSKPLIARAVLDGIIDNPTAGPDATLAMWNKIGPETKNLLFTPEHIRGVDDFLLLRKKIAENPNPSGSGQFVVKGGELYLHNPGITLTMPMISALLHSETGVRLLTRGFRLPATSTVARGAYVSALSKALQDAGQPALVPSYASDRQQ